MNAILILLAVATAIVFLWWRALRPKDKPKTDAGEHATMVKPRDKYGRWVKEGDGIIVPKGPSASWNRKKGVRK